MPQAGMAQASRQLHPGQGSIDEAIAPYVKPSNINPQPTGDDGSAREAMGQTTPIAPNIYAPQFPEGTQPQWNGDNDPRDLTPYRSETPSERAGRYYGAVNSTGDLSAAGYADDDGGSVRGKTRLKGDRLGVFGRNFGDSRELVIKPYIEAGQVAVADLAPNSDVLTYSSAAVGVDAIINGRNNQGQVSLRYERRMGWGRAANADTINGIAHLSSAIVPGTIRLDYGGYAGRSRVDASSSGFGASADSLSQIYSVYAGPSLTTHVGDVAVTGHYHIGHTSVGSPDGVVRVNGTRTPSFSDTSTVHEAKLAAGIRPGDAGSPIGVSVSGGFYQEDVSQLAQRVTDSHVRGEVTIPVSMDVALVGGVGYEATKISSHDAVRDVVTGDPVPDAAGRMITDYTSPRYIAFDSAGLIWDAGVIWRPSRRTNLEVHVGRRYGDVGVFGTFTYQPDSRTSFNVSAYNNVSGFGGSLTNSLFNMPSQFTALRDGITGNLNSCVATMSGGGCLASALGAVNSTVHRGSGISATYALDLGRIHTGVGMGYDRRRYISAPQTVLANLNGTVDKYYWMAAYLDGRLTENSTFETTVDVYSFHSGLNSAGDRQAMRAVGIYQYYLTRNLSTHASMAVDGIFRRQLEDVWTASGSVGMRYTF